MIIRTNKTNREYQYSQYKIGDVFEVIGEYDEHFIAKIISGSEPGGVIAVKKTDCETVHLGSYDLNDNIRMTT
tara:strand:- start:342 stop:560 length:219 start_codon:yes stop_codon:yes gene_type:complete